ncbi:10851_t:CDS:1 [Paraglomus occultum]|uniref:10851_t:CDS:1 n=1 Tax=Paraglomus occultum TaxID=144539 RepID=A0A9N8VIG5_9GLOM|nr:10851_t:CDS:1 [Paraglomus occultum]
MNPQNLFAQQRTSHFVNEQEINAASHGRRLTVQELLTDTVHNLNNVNSGNINVSPTHDQQHNHHSSCPPPTPQIHDINTIHEHNNHLLSARAVDSASTLPYFRPLGDFDNRNGYSKLLPRPTPPSNDELEGGGSYESNINPNYVNYNINISTHNTHTLSPTSPPLYAVMPPTSPATPISPNQQTHATIPLSEQRERNKIASAKYRKKKQLMNQEMSARINEMNSKISSLETENTMLRRQLEEVKGENQELRNTIDKLKNKLAKDKIFKRLERVSATSGKIRKGAGVSVVMARKG